MVTTDPIANLFSICISKCIYILDMYLQKIIDQLVANSDSFDKKTEFSKEKYLKKKKKRYIMYYMINVL